MVNVSTSKTGKHGHAKANFTAIDIFTGNPKKAIDHHLVLNHHSLLTERPIQPLGKKLEDIVPTSHSTSVPNVVRIEYQLLDISDDNFLSLLTENGDTKDDLKLPGFPEGFDDELRDTFDSGKTLIVTVVSAMGHDQVHCYACFCAPASVALYPLLSSLAPILGHVLQGGHELKDKINQNTPRDTEFGLSCCTFSVVLFSSCKVV